ncbi:capsid scaffolding serine peptidase GPO [Alteromonadaceae bacterium 2753L.S.0a.02]|nr:capsid scaffolding serine peptidase GPO [Alteromonadaceae bacterium 2753L.S.0a.02]
MSKPTESNTQQKTKKYKSKKFRIGKQGATTDGRKIERAWLEQAAKNYNTKKYGARVNLEHFKGILPDGPFKCYGDVVALSTEEENGELYLLAEIDPTESALKLNKERQKVYTSMELDTDFADSGQAYLVGLALTDSPASLGTDMLQFSANSAASPLASRKIRPENLFTEALEVVLEFDEIEQKPGVLESVKEMLSSKFKKAEGANEQLRADVVDSFEQLTSTLLENMPTAESFAELNSKHEALLAKFNKLENDHNALVEKLSKQPQTPPRSFATGGNNQEKTDC